MYKDVQFSIVYKSTRLRETYLSISERLIKSVMGELMMYSYTYQFLNIVLFKFTIGWKNKTKQSRLQNSTFGATLYLRNSMFIYMPREKSGMWC